MSVTVEEPRRLFRNNTNGWLGVVQVGPTGAAEGQAVEPEGTVWLSERECRLTAHAPRRAEDNPFLTQPYEIRDPETGAVTSVDITPLSIVEDTRAIPTSDRFIPGEEGVATAPTADKPDAATPVPQPPTRDADPLSPVVQSPPPPPVPPGVRAAVEAKQRAEEEQAALATPDKEETGAAVPSQGTPPQGEYAVHEEVGTPDASTAQPPSIKPYVGTEK